MPSTSCGMGGARHRRAFRPLNRCPLPTVDGLSNENAPVSQNAEPNQPSASAVKTGDRALGEWSGARRLLPQVRAAERDRGAGSVRRRYSSRRWTSRFDSSGQPPKPTLGAQSRMILGRKLTRCPGWPGPLHVSDAALRLRDGTGEVERLSWRAMRASWVRMRCVVVNPNEIERC